MGDAISRSKIDFGPECEEESKSGILMCASTEKPTTRRKDEENAVPWKIWAKVEG